MPEARPIQPVHRSDHRIRSEHGIEIAVREVRPDAPSSPEPILLIHGGGGGGIASFDSPVAGYSLLECFAHAGRIAVTLDLRGWGTSTRPPELDQPADAHPPAVSSDDACADISAVVDWAAERYGTDRIDLFGWATGGHWAAMWAARNPARVGRLASLNALYGLEAPWSMHAAFADPDDPARFNPAIGAYGIRDAASLLGAWNRTIPIDDKDAWRDPAVAEAYARETIAGDPAHLDRNPPSVRTPTGFQRDSFRQSLGHHFWDAENITADVLIIRGNLDFWSRPEDLPALARDLINARSVETKQIETGTHFVFLDQPERGRDQLITALLSFFAPGE